MDGSFKICTVYFFFGINDLMFQNLTEVSALCL